MSLYHYRNPLTKVYQYEYALYVEMSALFGRVECRSEALRTLALYYAELVSESAAGHPGYEKQYELEEACARLVERDVAGQTGIPAMHEKTAKLTIVRREDGTHLFCYRCGDRTAAVSLIVNGKGRVTGVCVRRAQPL